ncbi:MAG TPA: hypothetical protein PK583_00475 [Gammaproteobacteria bacterium]|nr:hypothetical protein [Gammaproteobacteria bacterium]
MATTTAQMLNTQLTKDKAAQTNTATPSLKTKELARFLAGTIHYHYENHFYTKLSEGADINFSGLDDRNEYVNPPLINAIHFSNTWAFNELLKRKADVHKCGSLFEAAVRGNTYMIRELLRHGADAFDYQKGTCLPITIETICSSALLDSQSRWRYENESPDTNNTVLKQQISDFFLQEGAYTPPKASAAIPFVAPEHIIHAHYRGKLEIIGLLLSRHVSPTIPVSNTTRSPLAIVQNPEKYSAHFRSPNPDDEQLEYIGTEAENPNVLIFTMTLINKRNTGTSSKIIVHYDLEPSRKLIEGAVAHLNPHMLAVTESLSKGMQETGKKLNAELQSQLDAVQAKLSDVHGATTQFTQEMKNVKETVHYDERQEIERFTLLINSHPNAKEAYKSFKIGLEAIHTSALAVKGGGVTVSEGSLSLVASVLGMTTELVDMIPLVGSAASKFFGLASVAAKEIDTKRQTNLFENIAAMATGKEARKIFESVARKLTMAYLLQFERLATKQIAQAQASRTQQSLQNAKGKVLNSRFKSPAEQVTAFATLWMIDEVFNNAHKLEDKEIAEKGLETILLNAVIQHKPAEKLTTFWNEITAKLGINTIPTQSASGATSAETWHPADFWTAPGVMVQNNSDIQYFAGNNTNVAKFGWRLGSLEDVAALGLMPTTETALLPQPSSPTVTHAYPNTPQASASSSTTSSPAASTQALKPELKPNNPPAPKRNRSPFGRLRTCLETS